MKLNTVEILEKYLPDGIEHSKEVSRIALMIFDEINNKVHQMKSKYREILDSACLLHDIGYFVGEKSHNKHSEKLILDNGLSDFDDDNRNLIACITRYHRGNLPNKKKHDLYGRLSKKDRKKVKRLGGILRLADGLTKGNLKLVKNLKIDYDEDNRFIKIILTPYSPDYSLDLTEILNKKDLLEKGFKSQVVVLYA